MDARRRIRKDMACVNSSCKSSDKCEFFVPLNNLHCEYIYSSVSNDENLCSWKENDRAAKEAQDLNTKIKDGIDEIRRRLKWKKGTE